MPDDHEGILQKAEHTPNTIAVSAVTGEGVDRLLDDIGNRLSGVLMECNVILPADKLQLLSWVYEHTIVDGREDMEDGSVSLDLRMTPSRSEELERRLGNGPKAAAQDW